MLGPRGDYRDTESVMCDVIKIRLKGRVREEVGKEPTKKRWI